MNEWVIFETLVIIIGFAITVGAPILKLVKSITALDNSVKNLRTDLDGLTGRNETEHKDINRQLAEDEKRLADHETRITVLEHK